MKRRQRTYTRSQKRRRAGRIAVADKWVARYIAGYRSIRRLTYFVDSAK